MISKRQKLLHGDEENSKNILIRRKDLDKNVSLLVLETGFVLFSSNHPYTTLYS